MAYYDKEKGRVIFGSNGASAQKPYTLDDYIKANNQFKKGYDANSNTAYLTDTKTGKTLSFLSGQGQEYGFGGIKNGSNVISDLNKLNSFFNTPAETENKGPDVATLNYMSNTNNSANTNNNANNTNNTGFNSDYNKMAFDAYKKLMDRNYQSSYSQDIADALAQIKNRQNFNYDPNTDQGLQAAQDEAQSATSRASARRGMLYSDSNKSQMGKAALNLIPQFRNQAYQEYSNDRNDLYNKLSALNNLENTAYQRYQGEGTDLYNQANLANNFANTDYNRYNADRTFNEGIRQFDVNKGISEAGLTGTYNGQRTMQGEANDLNRMNTMAQLTGQVPASQLIDNMSPEQRASYQSLQSQPGGFAAAIQATNDPVQKAIINEFRNQYLNANPDNPYYNTRTPSVMVPTMQGRQLESGLRTEALQQQGMELNNKYLPQEKELGIAALKVDNLMKQFQLDKLMPAQYQQLMTAIESGNLDNATKQITNQYLPQRLKADIQSVLANAFQSTQSGLHAGDSASIARDRLDWDKDPKNPDNIYKIAQASNSTSKPLSTTQKNQYRSEAYSAIKKLSVADAKSALDMKRDEIETVLGHEAYVKLYNDVLDGAIKAGQASPYNDKY